MSTSLEYHHVSQFYQTVLFFLIPLLTIQSCYICMKGIISHYEEAKLKEIKRWEKFEDTYQVDASTGMEPQQIQNAGPVRDSERRSMSETRNVSQPQLIRLAQVNQQFTNKQQLLQQSVQQERKSHNANIQMEMQENQQLQAVQKVQQEQHSNSKIQAQQISKEDIKEQNSYETQKQQQILVPAHIASMVSIQQRQQQGHQNQDSQNLDQQKQQQPKAQIVNQQQIPEQDEEVKKQSQYQNIETAITYAFKIDQIFDYYMPIIVCIIVLGILTQSVFIFSMFCFFCFLFSTLLFNYADVITRLKQGPGESSFFVRINYLLSGVFILILFISFWAADEYQV